MRWAIVFGVFIFLLLCVDLWVAVGFVVKLSARAANVATSNLRLGFFLGFACLIATVGLLIALANSSGVSVWGWTVVTLCLSAVLIGAAGYFSIDSLWRLAPLGLSVIGVISLLSWYTTLRSKFIR